MYHQEPNGCYESYSNNFDPTMAEHMPNQPMMPNQYPQQSLSMDMTNQMPVATGFQPMPIANQFQPMPSANQDQNLSVVQSQQMASNSAYMPMTTPESYYDGSYSSGSGDQGSRKRRQDGFEQGYGDTPMTKRFRPDGTSEMNNTGSSGYQSGFESPSTSSQVNVPQMPTMTMYQMPYNQGYMNPMSTPNWQTNTYAPQMAQMMTTNTQMTQLPAITAKADTNKENDDSGIGSSGTVALPDNQTVFTTFAARLQLLASSKKLDLSVAETKRRLHGPEGFNHSTLAAFCRKAKNKEGNERVSQDLAKHGLHIAAGHRKRLPNTRFTALCEMEAIQLVTDHRQIDKTDFPLNGLIYEIFKQMTSMQEYYAKYYQYRSVCQIVGLWEILARDNSPLVNAEEAQPLKHHHPDTQEKQTKFVNITHGYGNLAMVHSWTMLAHIASLIVQVYENPMGYCHSIKDQLPIPMVFNMLYAAQTQPQMMPNQYMGQNPQAAVPNQMGQNQQMMYPNQMNPNPQMMQNQQMQYPQTF